MEAEGSTIEPTMAVGAPYPAGNYGYDLVRGLRQVFGATPLYVNLGTTDVVAGLNRPPVEPSDGITTPVTVTTTTGP